MSEKNFRIIITETEATVIGPEINRIEISSGEVVTYYADNLMSGSYTLDFSDIIGETEDIVIYESHMYPVAGYEEISIVDNKAEIFINDYYYGGSRFFFKNNGTVPFSSKASIIIDKNYALHENIPTPIGVQRYRYKEVDYYFVGNSGTYVFAAELPQGTFISVTADNKDIVNYGGISGVFTTNAEGYALIKIYINNYGLAKSFNIYVNSIAGEMSLDKPTEIKLNKSNELDKGSATYSLGVLKAGKYSVETIKGISVAVNVNENLITDGTFEVTALSQACYITFFGNVAVTFDATVKAVESYILTLGANEITMQGYGYTEYYIELDAGDDYDITISGETAGISVRYEGMNIITDGETTGSFKASSAVAVLVIDNYGSEYEATFTITVTKSTTAAVNFKYIPQLYFGE